MMISESILYLPRVAKGRGKEITFCPRDQDSFYVFVNLYKEMKLHVIRESFISPSAEIGSTLLTNYISEFSTTISPRDNRYSSQVWGECYKPSRSLLPSPYRKKLHPRPHNITSPIPHPCIADFEGLITNCAQPGWVVRMMTCVHPQAHIQATPGNAKTNKRVTTGVQRRLAL